MSTEKPLAAPVDAVVMRRAEIVLRYTSETGIECEIIRRAEDAGFVTANKLGSLIGAAFRIVEWDVGQKKYLVEGLIESLGDEHCEEFAESLFRSEDDESA